MLTKEHSNILKGIAILMMFMHHLFYSRETYGGFEISFFPFTENIVLHLSWLCKACVAIFVFISGYGYAKSVTESTKLNIKYFISKYIKRIWGYWFVFILALLTSPIGLRTIEGVYGRGVKAVIKSIIDFLGVSFALGTPTYIATWWFMSIAVISVVMAPILCKITHTYIYFFVAILFVVSSQIQYIPSNFTSILHYLFILLVGIVFGKYDLFEKIKSLRGPRSLDIVLTVIILFMVQILRISRGAFLFDCITAICLAYLVLKVYNNRKSAVFSALGKYSMDMFLIHTFIFNYYCHEFVYGFRHFLLIFIMLALISLGIAFAIEQVKKLIKYDDFREKLIFFINNKSM